MHHDHFRSFEQSSQMKLIRAKGNTTLRTFFDQVLCRIKLRHYVSAVDKEQGNMLIDADIFWRLLIIKKAFLAKTKLRRRNGGGEVSIGHLANSS